MFAALPTEADHRTVVAAFGGNDGGDAPTVGSVSSDLGLALGHVLADLRRVAEWYAAPEAAAAPAAFFAPHEAAVDGVHRRMASACDFLGSGVAVWASGADARAAFGRFTAAAEAVRQWARDVLDGVHAGAVRPRPAPGPGGGPPGASSVALAGFPAAAAALAPAWDAAEDSVAFPAGAYDLRPSYAGLAERARALHSAEHSEYSEALRGTGIKAASLPLLRALVADVGKECSRLEAVRISLEIPTPTHPPADSAAGWAGGPPAGPPAAARFCPPLSHFTALRAGLQLLYGAAAAAEDDRAAAALRELLDALDADVERFVTTTLPALLRRRDGVDAACERTAAFCTYHLLHRRAKQFREAVVAAFRERQQRLAPGGGGGGGGGAGGVARALCCRPEAPPPEPPAGLGSAAGREPTGAPPAVAELAVMLGRAVRLWNAVERAGATLKAEFPAEFHSDWTQRVGAFTARLAVWAQGVTVVVAPPPPS